MPGSMFELRCSGCHTVHEISTGVGHCWEHHERWEYRQCACAACKRLTSRPFLSCCGTDELICERCGEELEPWTGSVWFERTPEGHVGAERVKGPCPRCATMLTERDSSVFGQWD